MATNPSGTGLQREDLGKKVNPAEVSTEIMDLATQARTILGYKVIQKMVTTPKTLREVLYELGIQPFSKRTVELYKSKMRKNAFIAAKNKYRKNADEPRWVSHDIKFYSGPIPESVLKRAIQIKQALPEVKFQIEQLNVEKPALPDPFLTASFQDEKYYIDVWDEPMFENAMLRGAFIQREEDFDEDD